MNELDILFERILEYAKELDELNRQISPSSGYMMDRMSEHKKKLPLLVEDLGKRIAGFNSEDILAYAKTLPEVAKSTEKNYKKDCVSFALRHFLEAATAVIDDQDALVQLLNVKYGWQKEGHIFYSPAPLDKMDDAHVKICEKEINKPYAYSNYYNEQASIKEYLDSSFPNFHERELYKIEDGYFIEEYIKRIVEEVKKGDLINKGESEANDKFPINWTKYSFTNSTSLLQLVAKLPSVSPDLRLEILSSSGNMKYYPEYIHNLSMLPVESKYGDFVKGYIDEWGKDDDIKNQELQWTDYLLTSTGDWDYVSNFFDTHPSCKEAMFHHSDFLLEFFKKNVELRKKSKQAERERVQEKYFDSPKEEQVEKKPLEEEISKQIASIEEAGVVLTEEQKAQLRKKAANVILNNFRENAGERDIAQSKAMEEHREISAANEKKAEEFDIQQAEEKEQFKTGIDKLERSSNALQTLKDLNIDLTSEQEELIQQRIIEKEAFDKRYEEFPRLESDRVISQPGDEFGMAPEIRKQYQDLYKPLEQDDQSHGFSK